MGVAHPPIEDGFHIARCLAILWNPACLHHGAGSSVVSGKGEVHRSEPIEHLPKITRSTIDILLRIMPVDDAEFAGCGRH